jgi:Uroporphyrinogen-III synthase
MQTNKIHILSTRPVDQAISSEAEKHNILIDEISFIHTEPVINEAIERKIKHLSTQNIDVVFTSMNAVEAVNNYITEHPSWKIFCIGNSTKNLVSKFFGSESISDTAQNAKQLAERIIQDKNIKAVTFFCGDQRRDELPEMLKNKGITVEEIIVYKTIETPEILKQTYDAILFYSPSAVNSFFLKNTIYNKTQLFAIGSTTANALQHFTQQPVIIAEIPGKENLVTIAINHFSQSKIS